MELGRNGAARFATWGLVLLLQLGSLSRHVWAISREALAPAGWILKWAVGTAAVSGTFHGLSGATTLNSPASATGRVGEPFQYTASIVSSKHGTAKSYTVQGVSPTPKDLSTLGFTYTPLTGKVGGVPNKVGTYRVKITGWERSNQSGDSTSFNATFVVEAAVVVAPSFSTAPVGSAVVIGKPITLVAAATGTEPIAYQWFKNGAAISGATSKTWSVASASEADEADYTVRASNAAGSVTSGVAHVTILTPPSLVGAPGKLSVVQGSSVNYTVAVAGKPAPTIQWRRGPVTLVGATSATLSIGAAAASDAGEYSVLLSNAAGSVTLTALTLEVTAPVLPPVVKRFEWAGMAGSQANFLCEGTPGRVCVVEYRDHLESGDWQVAGEVALGASGSGTVGAPVGVAGHRFWRARIR